MYCCNVGVILLPELMKQLKQQSDAVKMLHYACLKDTCSMRVKKIIKRFVHCLYTQTLLKLGLGV